MGFVTDDTELCRSDQLQEIQSAADGSAKHRVRFYFLRLHRMSFQAHLCECVFMRVCGVNARDDPDCIQNHKSSRCR